METTRRRLALAAIALLAVVATAAGWRLFWFLTDDAFIAFRYVSNRMLDRGLVWNPAPFAPVEGYTSFLWVALLELVWRATGVPPPESANVLSLGFGYVTLFFVWRIVARMALPPALERHRPPLLALVLLGTLTNRTFLAWLSSGLETALFNACVTGWVYFALAPPDDRGRRWIASLSTAAAATALTRPDGLLFCGATAAILAWDLVERRADGVRAARRLAWALPLLAVPLHLVWRRMTYGAWLPNTYYAKVVEPWPESGIRYLASFALEYALWVWVLLAIAALAARWRAGPAGSRPGMTSAVAVAALVSHAGYYTFVVGGDHFEYRVLSQLVPLLFVSGVWLAARAFDSPVAVYAALAVWIAASWPIPWIHWQETHRLESRSETHLLAHPIADRFPAFLRPPVAAFDALQAWLAERAVCLRHQEHAVFYRFMRARLPTRQEGSKVPWSDRPVMAVSSVGVVGWVLPHVAIIDEAGLNDRVIARSPLDRSRGRRMAHDRQPPPGYIECFQPSARMEDGRLRFVRRPLSDTAIIACEALGWERLREMHERAVSRGG